jgi:ubiquinone biosynthesis protein UbiJ
MAWLKLIESAGNHLLALDPDFLEQLKPFYKKTFRIELIEPGLTIDLRPCPDGFIVEFAGPDEPEVTLRGSLWAFVQLSKEGSHSDVFAQGRITMSGDAELGQAFQQVLGNLQIDWEELTSRFVGDMAARKLHRAIDDIGTWLKQSSRQFKENSGEYFQEELRVAPSKVEVDDMTDKIESLRSDTARLEARVAKLHNSLNPSAEQPKEGQAKQGKADA